MTTNSKGGRPATGTVKWRRNKKTGVPHWHARVTMPDGSRPWAALDPRITREEVEAAKACARLTSSHFREAGAVSEAVVETVGEYAKRWLADRDGRIASIDADRARMRLHVLPKLGPLDVRTFGRDDVESLRDDLDGKIADGTLAWKSVASVWTLVTSMCGDMVRAKKREFRVRDDNPCRDVLPPERGTKKAKQYLFPSEFLKFVSCERVPLRLRRAAAIAVYTFVRDGELRELRWDGGDLDLEHGTLSVTRAVTRSGKVKSTKSGETRRFAMEQRLVPLLSTMHDEVSGKGHIVHFRDRHMSRDLRLWLARAGVTRPELHKGDAQRKPLTWHDLRATGITWMAVRGDDPLKIKQRAGHSAFSTTEGYIREAEAVREGFGEVFPPLPACLLDPSGGFVQFRPGDETKLTIEPKTRGSRWRRWESNATGKDAPDPEKTAGSSSGVADVPSQSASTHASAPEAVPPMPPAKPKDERVDGVEADLERRIVEAELAGRTTIADVLARRLEAHRKARAAGNVVALPVPRKAGGRT